MDFNTFPPVTSVFQTTQVPIGINASRYLKVQAAVSDSAGKLLFYTNQGGIWRNGFRIPGSDTLRLGDITPEDQISVRKSEAFVLPVPGKSHRYALIHRLGIRSELYISIIEPLANNGRGQLVSGNLKLLDQIFMGDVRACKHGNGRDWWLIVPQIFPTGGFWVFLIEPNGIRGPAYYSMGDSQTECVSIAIDYGRSCALSADGRWLARRYGCDSIGLYGFDRCLGTVVLHRTIPFQIGQNYHDWRYVFSPDSRFLHVIRWNHIFSIDLEASRLPYVPSEMNKTGQSLDELAECDTSSFGYPLLAPDGKIYISQATFGCPREFYYVMHRPDLFGTAMDLEYRGLKWSQPGYISTELYFPDYSLGKWTDAVCDTLPSHVADPLFRHKEYVSFGHPLSSSATFPLLMHWPVEGEAVPSSPVNISKNEP